MASIMIFPDDGAWEEDAVVALEDEALDLSFLFFTAVFIILRKRDFVFGLHCMDPRELGNYRALKLYATLPSRLMGCWDS